MSAQLQSRRFFWSRKFVTYFELMANFKPSAIFSRVRMIFQLIILGYKVTVYLLKNSILLESLRKPAQKKRSHAKMRKRITDHSRLSFVYVLLTGQGFCFENRAYSLPIHTPPFRSSSLSEDGGAYYRPSSLRIGPRFHTYSPSRGHWRRHRRLHFSTPSVNNYRASKNAKGLLYGSGCLSSGPRKIIIPTRRWRKRGRTERDRGASG